MAINANINWADPTCKVSDHFTVKDCCWLPTWGRLHSPSDTEKHNLMNLIQKMEVVRAFLGNRPISVNCCIRPVEYNRQIGGAPSSQHIIGCAMDFQVVGMSCNAVRAALAGDLETFGLRMEKLENSPWVHLDTKNSKPKYFIP